VINATPDRVYAVLSDGWTYSDWVVGTAHIRDVDAGWPAHGTALHHKVGPWPLSIRDSSHVLDSEPDRMLHLRVRVWPFGEAQVRITLAQIGNSSTRVMMDERFEQGPASFVRNKVGDVMLHWRNKEALRRLADLATRRERVVL
jgi:hypothetical protein